MNSPYALTFSDAEEIQALYDNQIHSLRPTPLVLPSHFEKITDVLPQCHWPMLPASYRWVIDETGTILLYNHLSAPTHNFDFVIYGSYQDNRVNFLSRWDAVTHHSFAYTRTPPLQNRYARDNFPINSSGFKWNGLTFDRGHCIDFCDTMNLTNQKMVSPNEINPSISTLDPRNYTPEPPRTHWGRSLRKELVGAIRSQKGCYSQYLYYPETPHTTAYGTLIPKGCYFTELTSSYALQNIYHVPWDHPIHTQRAQGTDWRRRLSSLLTHDGFIPSPFVDDQRKPLFERGFSTLPFEYEIPERPLSYQESFHLIRTADTELSSVIGKENLSLSLLQRTQNEEETKQWLYRLLNHAQFLDELGSVHFLPERLTKKLLKALKTQTSLVDFDDRLYDHLFQIQAHQEDSFGLQKLFEEGQVQGEEIDFSNHIRQPQVNLPSVMDMNMYQKLNSDFYANIKAALQTRRPLQLLNLSTPRAKAVAEYINSLIETGALSQDVSIYYSPNSIKKWNIQPVFESKHIVARRLDF
ncbi:MAG: hypothetical protein JSS34_05080 [Proteobacteria bacterium]|nr:hypothetical protein [Pseudomonadota bacterium]